MLKPGVYIAKKSLQFVLTMVVLIIIVFFVSRLAPGDPLKSYFGDSLERMSFEQQDEARRQLGLDEPIPLQFTYWLEGAVRGDFGISYQYKQDALNVAAKALPNTLALTVTCVIIIFVLGIILSVICICREGKFIDKLICKTGIALNSIPEFFVALLLILIFCVTFNILPASGAYGLGEADSITSRMIHMILPVSAIVITHTWYIAYMMRNKLSEELRKEYVLMYRAKGLGKIKIYKHCLKNIMPAAISMMAIFLPHLLGGAYVIETVFSFPGIGKLGFDSAKYSDYNMLMLICIITGVAVVFINIVAQVINERLDPRMENEGRVL
jgi:peptide/nickel transport system permease protein